MRSLSIFPSKSFPNISLVWQKSMTKSPKAFTNPPVSSTVFSKVLSLQALHFSLQSLQRHLDASSLAGGQFSIYKHVPPKKRTYCTNVFKYKQNHIAMATHTEICFTKVDWNTQKDGVFLAILKQQSTGRWLGVDVQDFVQMSGWSRKKVLQIQRIFPTPTVPPYQIFSWWLFWDLCDVKECNKS